MSREEGRLEELEVVRWTLLRAGLRRDEEELERLLSWFGVHRDGAARIAGLPLSEVQPQVVFDPRWRG